MNSPYYIGRRVFLAVRSVSAKPYELTEAGRLHVKIRNARTVSWRSKPLSKNKYRKQGSRWRRQSNPDLQGLWLMESHRMPLHEQICYGEFPESRKHHI